MQTVWVKQRIGFRSAETHREGKGQKNKDNKTEAVHRINPSIFSLDSVKETEGEKYLQKPEVELTEFKCPIIECSFISDKHFIGLRIHMAEQHFSEQIRLNKEANANLMPRISSCMSNWNCSINQLKASGDLVHQCGICQCFQKYANLWIFN